MSRTVRNPGGVLVRLAVTISGFKATHGCWPTSVSMGQDSLISLLTYSLTPQGLFNLQSKIDLMNGPDDTVVAFGEIDRSLKQFDYSDFGSTEVNTDDAYRWLGLNCPE